MPIENRNQHFNQYTYLCAVSVLIVNNFPAKLKLNKNQNFNIIVHCYRFLYSLTQIVTTTNHICYIKLIVSGLDYTVDALPRQVLEKALVASERSAGRLYATQFMLVLLRAKIPNFEVWGLPMLIKQTRDKERKVVLAALEILDEACHDRVSIAFCSTVQIVFIFLTLIV